MHGYCKGIVVGLTRGAIISIVGLATLVGIIGINFFSFFYYDKFA
jgi:hypothetical protein